MESVIEWKKSGAIALFILFLGSLIFLMGVEIGDAFYRAFG